MGADQGAEVLDGFAFRVVEQAIHFALKVFLGCGVKEAGNGRPADLFDVLGGRDLRRTGRVNGLLFALAANRRQQGGNQHHTVEELFHGRASH